MPHEGVWYICHLQLLSSTSMGDASFESYLLEELIPEDVLDSDLLLRPLDSQDYSKGFPELLSQLQLLEVNKKVLWNNNLLEWKSKDILRINNDW